MLLSVGCRFTVCVVAKKKKKLKLKAEKLRVKWVMIDITSNKNIIIKISLLILTLCIKQLLRQAIGERWRISLNDSFVFVTTKIGTGIFNQVPPITEMSVWDIFSIDFIDWLL